MEGTVRRPHFQTITVVAVVGLRRPRSRSWRLAEVAAPNIMVGSIRHSGNGPQEKIEIMVFLGVKLPNKKVIERGQSDFDQK